MDLGTLFTKLLSITTLLGNVLSFLFLLAFVFARPFFWRVMVILGRQGVWIGALLATGATVGSLVYSEIVGFAACILCWIQRIFMYPQMFLLLLAWWKKIPALVPVSLVLSLIGGAVALYNWAKDMLGLYSHLSLACPVVPGLPSCDRIYVLEYGYITISMFALNIFILLSLVLYAVMRKDSSSAAV